MSHSIKEHHTRRQLIIVDDQLATAEGQVSFLRETGASKKECLFETCWSQTSQKYTLKSFKNLFTSLNKKCDIVSDYLILLDVAFGDEEYLGLEILDWLVQAYPALPVIMMTSHLPMGDGAFSFKKRGAFDCIFKRLESSRFWQIVNRYILKDSSQWILGSDARTLGMCSMMSGFETTGAGIFLQASKPNEAQRWCHYICECVMREQGHTNQISEVDLQAMTAEGDIWLKLVGQELQSWDDFECKPGALLTHKNPIIIHNIEFLPSDLQILLGRSILGQSDATTRPAQLPYLIVSTLNPLNKLLEKGFYGLLAKSLTGKTLVLSQDVNTEASEMAYLIGINKRIAGVFDSDVMNEESISFLNQALEKVAVTQLENWWNSLLLKISATPNLSIQELLGINNKPIQADFHFTEKLKILRVSEVELLVNAYKKCHGNRTQAIVLLKQNSSQKKWTTNHFDRWFKMAWKSLDNEDIEVLETKVGCAVLEKLKSEVL